MSHPAIAVCNLYAGYDGTEVFHGIEFQVTRREFFGIVGPSGTGASTLLLNLGRHLPTTSGEIWLNGVNSTGVPAFKRPLRTVLQGSNLFPHMSVGEDVAFPLKVSRSPRGTIRERVEWILARMELDGLGHRWPPHSRGARSTACAFDMTRRII